MSGPENKPTYPNAFDMIAALPSDLNPLTIALLIWIWRHTNSDTYHTDFGKAWKSQANLALEMHTSDKTVQRAFDDAESRGLIRREHLFNKNGKIIVSAAPYRKAASRGMGEYMHSRYWINWDRVREIGVVTKSTPIANGVVRASTPVVGESTKVLTEGFSSPPIHLGENPLPEGRPKDFDRGGWACSVVVGNRAENQNPKARTGKANGTASRTEDIIARSERDRADRKMTNDEIYREYKNVFDRLKREYVSWKNTSSSERCGMPMGRDFEKDLRANRKHREAAASLFRAEGREVVLAAWEQFLVDTDHDIPVGVPVLDDNYQPTGKYTSSTEERAWFLHDFVLNYVPVRGTASQDLIEVAEQKSARQNANGFTR